MEWFFDLLYSLFVAFFPSSNKSFFKNSYQIEVAVLSEKPKLLKETLEFEIRNMGDKTTSLEPVIVVSIYSKKGSLECVYFDIYGNDTELPVGTSRKFVADIRESQAMTIGNRVACYRFSEINGSSVEIVVE